MNRFLTMTFAAAAAAILLAGAAAAQAPGAPARPAPAASELPPFDTAQTDANSWMGRFGPTNCAWFDLGDGVLLLDTGASSADAKNLLAEVKRTVPDKPVRWVVMTHFHPDSNDGFAAMLPSDVMLIVNQRALDELAGVLRSAKGKTPTLVGVADKLVLRGKSLTLEIYAPATPAHTAFDVWLYTPASGVVYVGDLVTATRCPIASDPGADPKGWLAVLDRIEALHPQALVATRGPAVTSVSAEILKTRNYLKRVLGILTEMKAKGAPEARVSGELVAKKIGDYCPLPLDTQNVLELYRRMTPEGTFPPVKPAKPAAAPAPKK